jgi:uncharacterized membrane protein YsdA (DUF1294 family)
MRRKSQEDIAHLTLWILFGAAAFISLGFVDLSLTWPWRAFVAVNVATLILYGYDKMLAVIGARRVSERALHAASFLFGSPGAVLGMNLFRHKTRKISFQFVLAVVILIQILILIALERYVLR